MQAYGVQMYYVVCGVL